VKMMQALQGQVQVLHDQAQKIAKTENTARVCDKDGVFQPVSDEGGRHEYKNIVLDMQSILKNIDRQSEVKLQNAAAGSERCIVVCPDALAVPTNGPLNAYDARTYPISSVHWWFGDGAPNLDRDRKMLFEEVARMLLDREELEYHLVEDEDKYIARSPGRFTEPEVCAMLGDAVRRLALLQGVRGTMQRKGFWQDLKAIAEASTEDFMIAQNIATPGESLGSAASRSDMPAKVRTALRSLLISTANVFGTEGRKQSLRHEMHAANLLFGAGTFFTTPNHADTHSPLMLLLHRRPSSNDHLAINASENHDSPKQDTSALDILSETPTMPSLEAMHEISAKNPRAQARFYLLMQELHFKFVHGFDTLRIGRKTVCKPGIKVVRHDWYASNLQPSITPAAADATLPGEAQGRGFTHGHAKGHSRIGMTLAWLRENVNQSATTCVEKIRSLQQALLSAAASVQFESANEPGEQLGVTDLPPAAGNNKSNPEWMAGKKTMGVFVTTCRYRRLWSKNTLRKSVVPQLPPTESL